LTISPPYLIAGKVTPPPESQPAVRCGSLTSRSRTIVRLSWPKQPPKSCSGSSRNTSSAYCHGSPNHRSAAALRPMSSSCSSTSSRWFRILPSASFHAPVKSAGCIYNLCNNGSELQIFFKSCFTCFVLSKKRKGKTHTLTLRARSTAKSPPDYRAY
jgi:hypothetical protein